VVTPLRLATPRRREAKWAGQEGGRQAAPRLATAKRLAGRREAQRGADQGPGPELGFGQAGLEAQAGQNVNRAAHQQAGRGVEALLDLGVQDTGAAHATGLRAKDVERILQVSPCPAGWTAKGRALRKPRHLFVPNSQAHVTKNIFLIAEASGFTTKSARKSENVSLGRAGLTLVRTTCWKRRASAENVSQPTA
jgi:hypothetical protein